MKLVIMIPCLNEEETLPIVFETMPKKISGIDEIEILVIDDGCTDKTVEVARSLGVKHFIHHRRNQGLSRSFRHGLLKSLEMGADIIVLTEGDNQYKQDRIADLIQPILNGTADVVISDRMTQSIEHFSPYKKFFQKLGTWVLNKAAGTKVPDAISGFRAYSRNAAIELNPVANYSWATETTIQAARKFQAITIMPIPTNPKLRESRQFKSSWQHIRKSANTIMRAFIMYNPYAIFISLSIFLLIIGLIPFGHYIYLVFFTPKQAYGAHHLQWLIIGGVLLTGSFISFTLGIVSDLISINRMLLEDILTETKRHRLDVLKDKDDNKAK